MKEAIPLTACVGRLMTSETIVGFTDCDMYGHVTTAKYLEMAIDHRYRAIEQQLGIDFEDFARQEGVLLVNRKVTMRFLMAAKLHDPILIQLWIDSMRGFRSEIEVRMRHAVSGTPLCDIRIDSVAVDVVDRVPVPLPRTFVPAGGATPLELPWAPGHPRQGPRKG